MKNMKFLSENFQFLEVIFSIYLNRRVIVMFRAIAKLYTVYIGVLTFALVNKLKCHANF